MTESAVFTTAFAGQQQLQLQQQTNNKKAALPGIGVGTGNGTTSGTTVMHVSTLGTSGRANGHGYGQGHGARSTGPGTGTTGTALAGSPPTISSTCKLETATTAGIASMAAAAKTGPPMSKSMSMSMPYPAPSSKAQFHVSSANKPMTAAGTSDHDLNSNDIDTDTDAEDHDHDHDHDHHAPSLTLHSHRQNHNSSKLPAVRSTNILHSGSSAASSFPSQQRLHHTHPGQVPHSHHDAPSPALPNPGPDQQPAPSIPDNIANADAVAVADADADAGKETTKSTHPSSSTSAASPSTNSPPRATVRSRASSYHASPQCAASSPSSTSPGDPHPAQRKRPASCPEPGLPNVDQTSPSSVTGTAKYLTRRGPASRSSNGVSTSDGPPRSLNSHRLQAVEAVARIVTQCQAAPETPEAVSTQGRRELLLLKRLSGSSSSDENRQPSSQRPPVSYRSTNKRHSIQPANLTPGKVPPIRSFRSSGSRKSLTQDMNFTSRPYDLGESYATSPEDQTLHNFGGRQAYGGVPLNNGGAGRQDDGGDVFLRIARDEPTRHLRDEDVMDDTQSTVSGVRRASHRRPLSTVLATYNPSSPPRTRRRSSDLQERPRPTYLEDDQGSEISRTTTFRPLLREKAASVHPGDEILRTRSGGAHLRPSPLSARSTVGYDNNQEGSVYARRRASITDSNSTVGGRTPGYRSSGLSQNRNYGSSPLVKTIDFQNRMGTDGAHGLEGTESTASTTAPSTVWDELDDMKSRINRLELTGKLPSTSGAAVSGMSDERPATATTTVTTMSGSPKRQLNGQVAEASSTTSSQKEAHPVLHAALLKSKPFLNSGVYEALESAAKDAMALSSMMGSPGQPGPISSAASVIGTGGPAVTDRQLRRKADSVCRSLTELCVALGDGVGRPKSSGQSSPPALVQHDGPATPTVPKSYSGLPAPRRLSVAEQGVPKSLSSPRALSKFEERRSSILYGTALPTPRSTGSTPTTPIEGNPQRRSSLMISRTRRAGTEEPELGRTPTVLRSRRAGTEEPEEGRQTSFYSRNRRGTVGEDGDEGRFRPPSRAGTDVNMFRSHGRDHLPESQPTPLDNMSQIPSALPRRRFLSTNLHSSRLAGSPGSNTVSPRRYLDRQTADNEMGDNYGDSPVQRQAPPLSKGMAHTRTSSLSTRRNRDSVISTNSGAAISPYR